MEEKKIPSRLQRNEELYKEIANTDIDGYELRSNAKVIGNSSNIDVDKIKDILDTHYSESSPKRKSINIEDTFVKKEVTPMFETKEYDINLVLDKAREEKEIDYNVDRNKHLRNEQFDILNNLNLNKDDFIEDYENEKDVLQDLINTININEAKEKEKAKTEVKDIDLFEDLKGNENTTLLESADEIEKGEMTAEEKLSQTKKMDDTFFTKSNKINTRDFEDNEEKGGSVGMTIFIILIIIVLIVGGYLLFKQFFN